MSTKNLPPTRRKAQPEQLTRLLELAERRGYSARALTALALSAITANANLRRPRSRRKVVKCYA